MISYSDTNPPPISEHTFSGERLALLALFTHPEDESFGPAGTLAKYANEGVQVTLVTATRAEPRNPIDHDPMVSPSGSRDRLCSCRASGVRRGCLLDFRPGQLASVPPLTIQDQFVRLIREFRPQVVVTMGPEGLVGDADHRVIHHSITAAFRDAGDPDKFPEHMLEGLGPFAPQKLYHSVLPSSVVKRWGVQGISSVPDEEVTTMLDVSPYYEAMKSTLFCQRSRAVDFIQWLTEERSIHWDKEYFSLVESRLHTKPKRERDLFAGLR